MKITLLSDTHGHLDAACIKHASEGDEIWHAGDIGHTDILHQLSALKPLCAVYGNIDGADVRAATSRYLLLNREGLRFLLIHIAGTFGNYNPETRGLIQRFSPDVLICGHSHILKVARDQRFSCMYINPGAAGNHGFHPVKTMIRFEVSNGSLQNMDVIETGRRARIIS